jgi:uncharacterized glyoxalase superfamily protein PhnB
VDEKSREAEDRRQQAADERSAQARTVKMSKSPRSTDEMDVILHNFSDGHLEAVNVVSVNVERQETKRHVLETMSPGAERRVTLPLPATGDSYVSFIDAKGLSWKLYLDGRLEEQAPKGVTVS